MNPKQLIYLIPILYIIAWCISPPLSYGVLYRIIAIVLVLYLLNKNLSCSTERQRNRLYYSIFLIVYMIFIGLIVQDKFVQRIHIYIFLLVGVTTEIWYNNEMPKSVYRNLILVTFLLFIVWNYCSINALEQNSHIMRALVRNSDESFEYAKKGVGGYGYLYSMVLAMPFGVSILLNPMYDNKLRLVALLFTVSSLYLSFISEYFMAELLAIAVVPLIFVSKMKSQNNRRVAYFVIILGLIIVFSNAESIIAFLVNETDSAAMQRKLTDSYMIMANNGEVSDSEFGTRAKRYGQAIDALISNPVTGVLTYRKVGNHSYFLDYFGQYGIFIGYLFIYLFFSPISKFLKNNSTGVIVILMTIIVALFNVLPLSCIVPIYILLPATIQYQQVLENERC